MDETLGGFLMVALAFSVFLPILVAVINASQDLN